MTRLTDRFWDILLPFCLLAVPVCGQPVLRQADSSLVELARMNLGWRFDIRYATSENAFGLQLYGSPNPRLVREAAMALARVETELEQQGLGLVIYDAYRPWRVTKKLWDTVDSSKKAFVANPARGSRHNRGCAVDVGLVDLKTGVVLEMPTDFDDFTEQAAAFYPNVTEAARTNRTLLRDVMEANGFRVLANEWWHFDFTGWESHPLLDVE